MGVQRNGVTNKTPQNRSQSVLEGFFVMSIRVDALNDKNPLCCSHVPYVRTCLPAREPLGIEGLGSRLLVL